MRWINIQCQQPFAACIHKWNIHHLLLYRFSLLSLVTIFIMDHTLGAPSFLFYSLCDIFFNNIIHYILLDHRLFLFLFHPLSVLFDFKKRRVDLTIKSMNFFLSIIIKLLNLYRFGPLLKAIPFVWCEEARLLLYEHSIKEAHFRFSR